MRRISQISNSHCGPAVLQMLLHNLGIDVTQKQIVSAGQAGRTLKKFGMRIDQLALATRKLAPEAQFWYKNKGSVHDLKLILNYYGYPIGVEWQGIFESREEEEMNENPDYGHYSIITRFDKKRNNFVIIDPFKQYDEDRYFSIKKFVKRWWDTNTILNKENGKKRIMKDEKTFFIITAKSVSFPKKLKMKRFVFRNI